MSYLKWPTRLILAMMGWRAPDPGFKILKEEFRLILVFAHTSYLDFLFMFLYRLAYPQYGKYLYTVVKPQPFDWPLIGSILRRIGCLPATRREDRGHGFVDRTVETLKETPFHLLISPKGTIVQAPWRSGYYWIGRRLNAKFVVTGIDYAQRRPVIKTRNAIPDPWCQSTEETSIQTLLENLLKEDLATIIPRNPEWSEVPITTKPPALINKYHLLAWTLGLTIALIGLTSLHFID